MRRLAQQNHTQEISHIPELANSGCEGGLFRKHHFYGHRGRKSSPGQHLKDLEFMNDLRWSWKMKDLMYYESYIILWCIDFAEWWKDNGPKKVWGRPKILQRQAMWWGVSSSQQESVEFNEIESGYNEDIYCLCTVYIYITMIYIYTTMIYLYITMIYDDVRWYTMIYNDIWCYMMIYHVCRCQFERPTERSNIFGMPGQKGTNSVIRESRTWLFSYVNKHDDTRLNGCTTVGSAMDKKKPYKWRLSFENHL